MLLEVLAHGVLDASLAKRLSFLIRVRRGRRNLLRCLVLETINVKLLGDVAAQAQRPAVRARYIRTECPRLRHVTDRRGFGLISFANVVITEPGLVGAETEGLGVRKVLSPVEVAGFVKN